MAFLSTLNPTGFPAHRLLLKMRALLLLWNLDPPKLCHGTRMEMKALHRNVIKAMLLTSNPQEQVVFIPCILFIPPNNPFRFKRQQFPLKVCFAMMIRADIEGGRI